jgi:predicted dehydrogenase
MKTQIGVIGAGEIVTKLHLPVLKAIPEVEVKWIFDVDQEKTKRVAKAFGIEARHAIEGLENAPADVVVLGIPYGVRAPYYELLSGRPLYVEKPLARTVREHRALCDRFPEHALACGLQRRVWGPTQLVRRMVKDRLFGNLQRVRYGWGHPVITTGNGYAADTTVAGGGVLFESGIHGLDTSLFCAGATAGSVLHSHMLKESDFDIHTDALLSLSLQDGRQIECEIVVSCVRETDRRVEFIFDHASVWFDLFGPSKVHVCPKGGRVGYDITAENGSLYPASVPETMLENWRTYLDGLKSERVNTTSASQSILTTQFIEQLYSNTAVRALAEAVV